MINHTSKETIELYVRPISEFKPHVYQLEELQDRNYPFLMGHDLDPVLSALLGLGPTGRPHFDAVLNSMIADALFGHRDGRAVSVSLNKNKYRGLSRYHPAMQYGLVRLALNELENRRLLLVEKGLPWPAGRGRQTTFRASPELLALAGDAPRLRCKPPHEPIHLRDRDKNTVDYRETARTLAMRQDVRALSEAVGSSNVWIAAPDIVWATDGFVTIPDGQKQDGHFIPRTIHSGHRHYRRVFNNSSFNQGGRSYGHWSQSLHKSRRSQIQISGSGVELLDYGASHICILYAQAGVPLDGDPYDAPGIERDEAKLGLLIAINAASNKAASMALAAEFAKKDGFVGEGFPVGVYCSRANHVLEAIKDRHPDIARSFCSSVGVHLQFEEAEVLTAVLRKALKQGIVCLPVHDELIVSRQHASIVEDLMMECWANRFGTFAVL